MVNPALISNKEFFFETPLLHPKSFDYKLHWKTQIERCIGGYWVSGKWMPPRLYYYANFHHIKLNKGKHSKSKIFSLPFIRDVEWDFFYLFEEARGFSGFDGDERYSCLEKLEFATEEEKEELRKENPEIYSELLGRFKEYIPVRNYIKQVHPSNMGVPIYNNDAKNFMLMSGRGIGKSYLLSALGLHEWLFRGAKPIHKYMTLDEVASTNPKNLQTSVVIGGGDSKKIGETIAKVEDAFIRLPGSYEHADGKLSPSPLSMQYMGSFKTTVEHRYKKKQGGKWIKAGSGSKIRSISFMDNEFAIQGDRNNLILIEEVGHFKNLIAVYNASVHNMIYNGVKKFGTFFATGTGGSMDSLTLDAQYMFYNPKAFNMLTFNDEWENRGQIAYFVPSHMGLNHLRDAEGIIDKEKAIKELKADREKSRVSMDRSLYEKEITYKAELPSEVFMMTDGNIFPVLELKEHLTELEKNNTIDILEKVVELKYSPNAVNGVDYKLLDKGEARPVNQFPYPDGFSKEGQVVIYEFPIVEEADNKVPDDLYIIGHDPFRTDGDQGSFAATIVMKTNKYGPKYGHNEIVAVYYGRPFGGREVANEHLLKLALFYNAKVMFENNVGNVKDYFEKKKRLDLLYRRPTSILTSKDQTMVNSESIEYGYPLSNQKNKMEVLQYIKTWLLEERGRENIKNQIVTFDRHGRKKILEYSTSESSNEESQKVIRNLNKIYDRRLLQELINYNLDGNFDAVHGLAGCIIALEDNWRKKTISVALKENENKMSFLRNNEKLFQRSYNSLMLNEAMKKNLGNRHIEKPDYMI